MHATTTHQAAKSHIVNLQNTCSLVFADRLYFTRT